MKKLTYIVLITASLATSSVYARTVGVEITKELKATVTSKGAINNISEKNNSKATQNLASVSGDNIKIDSKVLLTVTAKKGGITNKTVGVDSKAVQQISSIVGKNIKIDKKVELTATAGSFYNSANGKDSTAIQNISTIHGNTTIGY